MTIFKGLGRIQANVEVRSSSADLVLSESSFAGIDGNLVASVRSTANTHTKSHSYLLDRHRAY